MEGEKEEQGESTESVTTSASVETTVQNCSEDGRESPNLQQLQEEEKEERDDGETEPSQAEEDISGAERLPQETLTTTNQQDDADCLPLTALPTEEETTPPSVSSHPSNTHSEPSDPCWYCLRSLDSDYRPEATIEQGGQDPSSPLPSSGQKVSYQTDPRPHFGVAWSSHSTCRPLWGSEGPSWGPRNQEAPDQTHTCPHCYLGLPPETLRWHEAKCLLFEGLRNAKK